MHAPQTCKKVKAAMHTRFANGAHYGAYAPLGYVTDPDKKGHLLIDPETRWIVEKIFDLAVHGRGAASITPVSYTHLDVYKRQPLGNRKNINLFQIYISIIKENSHEHSN